MTDFQRIAIVNRGEAALRLIRALRDYNAEFGTQIESLALVTTPDLAAPFAREADLVVELDIPAGKGAAAAYLDVEPLLATMVGAGADAVWVGWGFLAEDAHFAQRISEEDLVFIGPSPEAMHLAGDKVAAKKLAEQAEVPVVPWSGEALKDFTEVSAVADRIGFPLILKAAAGGGGRGIRRVDERSEIEAAFTSATREAERAFGDGRIFVERCVQRARHLEVQVAVDHTGTAHAFGVRDCTLQRRNQKVIEEAPGPHTTPSLAEKLEGYALAFASAAGYRNVGTVEFIYDLDLDEPYFMEMNTRLQVEHPVTELLYGVDLVKLQLQIALERTPELGAKTPRGYAIELRVNAEDPDNNFAPSPGEIVRFKAPQGPGIRVDSGVCEGYTIPPDFDSNIAKIIAWGSTRQESIARLRRALMETSLIVRGGATNKAFLSMLLQHRDVLSADLDTGWLDRMTQKNAFAERPWGVEALLAGGVLAYRAEHRDAVTNFYAAANRGVPQTLSDSAGQEATLTVQGARHSLKVYEVDQHFYRVYIDDVGAVLVHFKDEGKGSARMGVGDKTYRLLYEVSEQAFALEVEGVAHRVTRDAGGVVRAPAPSMVMDIAVQEGDEVKEGQRLGSLEAMKMEMPFLAPQDGRVREILVMANSQVAAGQAIMILQSLDDGGNEQERSAEDIPELELPSSRDPFLELFEHDGAVREAALKSVTPELCYEFAQAIRSEILGVILGYDLDDARLNLLFSLLDREHLWAQMEAPDTFLSFTDAVCAFSHTEGLFSADLIAQPTGGRTQSVEGAFWDFVRNTNSVDLGGFNHLEEMLERAFQHYGMERVEPGDELRAATFRLVISHGRTDHRSEIKHRLISSLLRVIIGLHNAGGALGSLPDLNAALEKIPMVSHRKWPFVADNALQTHYVIHQQPRFERPFRELKKEIVASLARAAEMDRDTHERRELIQELVDFPQNIFLFLAPATRHEAERIRSIAGEVLLRRHYGGLIANHKISHDHGAMLVEAHVVESSEGGRVERRILAAVTDWQNLEKSMLMIDEACRRNAVDGETVCDILVHPDGEDEARLRDKVETLLAGMKNIQQHICRLCLVVVKQQRVVPHFVFRADASGVFKEHLRERNLHPEMAERLDLHRLSEFDLERVDFHERLVILRGTARSNPGDERIFVVGEVPSVPESAFGNPTARTLLAFEHLYLEAMRVLREIQAQRNARQRYHWNRLIIHIRPTLTLDRTGIMKIGKLLSSYTRGLGLDRVVVRAHIRRPDQGDINPPLMEFIFSNPTGHKLEFKVEPPRDKPVPAATPYELKVRKARGLGVNYPYEVIRMLTSQPGVHTLGEATFPPGLFTEYDLEPGVELGRARAVIVDRSYGENRTSLVFGLIQHQTEKHPEGMERVLVLSDPLRGMGSLAGEECARIIAALDLAERRQVPLEWVPVSAGAKIAIDSGTENLDWTARTLRRLIEFTQKGGEVNVIVDGVNVGAQSYFNAEATMLMHTRGILVMTPRGSMVLTGKRALDYSGSVSAEDERGVGGYDRIMGPNGQGQYRANDLEHAFQILLQHYEFAYRKPGENSVRKKASTDAAERDVTVEPYGEEYDEGFETIGEIFSAEHNRERKRPFAMRALMKVTMDRDGGFMERFADLHHAETAIVWDCHLGGHAITMIGFESRPVARRGFIPGDGPDSWSGGTLFPQSSRKVSRAINAASGNRPVVLLANLSGFDGSPESMRRTQLEYGAEIGRAVVNFDGPIIFAVVARYHGGAYVVFSKALNENLVSMAVEGSFASVIGGAPAAAVVFPREVRARTLDDPRVVKAIVAVSKGKPEDRPRLREAQAKIYNQVYSEHQGDVAREFDEIHSVERACKVGSLDAVIAPENLRSELVLALDSARPARETGDGL